jgi:aspartyl-tRNA(Asn)/glutamyl-tRNA(Gln) amidotransferase subunit C
VASGSHNVGDFRPEIGIESRRLAENERSAIGVTAGSEKGDATPCQLNMSVDAKTVGRVAHLARVAVAEDEIEHLAGELNAMLAFVEQLSEVDVTGVEPMTSVTPMTMKKRKDEVTDGGIADAILANAPASEDQFFLVPKVVE